MNGNKKLIISSAFPEQIFSSADIQSFCGCPIAFQEEKLGIFSRHVLKKEETAFALAQKACEKLFVNFDVKKEDIDCLLYVTQTPEKQIPQNSSLLQHELGLPTHIFAYDISLGCSGYVYALSTAKALMKELGFSNVLIVCCDCYSKITDSTDKNTTAIFGDGAAATLLNDADCIGAADFGTDGKNAYAIMLDEHKILRMNGRAVFEFALKTVKKSVLACLEKNGCTLADIDYFVFHQANRFMLEQIALSLSVPKEKLVINLENRANTVSASIPLAMENLLPSLQEGQKLLACGFGVGLSWATTIITM